MQYYGGIIIADRGNTQRQASRNDRMIKLSHDNPKLIPICSVHPYDSLFALKEIERLKGKGVAIIKLHPFSQEIEVDDERVLKLRKKAGEIGITVLIDNANITSPGDIEHLLNLALECKETTFIYAHMGGISFRSWNILKLIKANEDFCNNYIH